MSAVDDSATMGAARAHVATMTLLSRPGWSGCPVVVIASRAGSYVALVRETEGGGVPAAEHLLVGLDGPSDDTWRRCADVLYGAGPPELADRTLRSHPHTRLVTIRDAAGECVAVSRCGLRIRVTAVDGNGAMSMAEHEAMAALLHAWLVAALPLEALTSSISTHGARQYMFADAGGRPTAASGLPGARHREGQAAW